MNSKFLQTRYGFFILLSITIGAFLTRLFAAVYFPLERDEEWFLANAQLILHNYLPMRDFFAGGEDPLFLFLIANWLKIFGCSLLNARFLSVIASTITTFFIYKIGIRFGGKAVGLISAGVFAFAPFSVRYGYCVFTEPLAIMFTTIAIYFLICALQSNRKIYFLLNALLLAIAFFIRKSVGFVIVGEPIFVFLFYLLKKDGFFSQTLKRGLTNVGIIFIGYLLPALPVIAYIVVQKQTDIFYFIGTLSSIPRSPAFQKLPVVFEILAEKAFLLLLPAVLFTGVFINNYLGKKIKPFFHIFVLIVTLVLLNLLVTSVELLSTYRTAVLTAFCILTVVLFLLPNGIQYKYTLPISAYLISFCFASAIVIGNSTFEEIRMQAILQTGIVCIGFFLILSASEFMPKKYPISITLYEAIFLVSIMAYLWLFPKHYVMLVPFALSTLYLTLLLGALASIAILCGYILFRNKLTKSILLEFCIIPALLVLFYLLLNPIVLPLPPERFPISYAHLSTDVFYKLIIAFAVIAATAVMLFFAASKYLSSWKQKVMNAFAALLIPSFAVFIQLTNPQITSFFTHFSLPIHIILLLLIVSAVVISICILLKYSAKNKYCFKISKTALAKVLISLLPAGIFSIFWGLEFNFNLQPPFILTFLTVLCISVPAVVVTVKKTPIWCIVNCTIFSCAIFFIWYLTNQSYKCTLAFFFLTLLLLAVIVFKNIKVSLKKNIALAVLLLWMLCMLLFYVHYQYMPPYFSEFTPVASIMCAILLVSMHKTKHTIKVISMLLVVFLIGSGALATAAYSKDYSFTHRTLGGYLPLAPTIAAVGDYIKKHTNSEDEIVSWPIYSFESDRRQVFDIVYWPAYSPTERSWCGPPESHGYPSMEELIVYINQTHTKYIVVDYIFKTIVLDANPQFREFLDTHYYVEITIDGVLLYREKSFVHSTSF